MQGKIILNVAQIRDKIDRFSYPKAQSIGKEKARIITNTHKERFLNKFQSHDITEEINAGASATGSLQVNGNLFSFIGFESGSQPIQDLYEYLQNSIKLIDLPGVYNATTKTLTYKFTKPEPDRIKTITDMANYTDKWSHGKSWISMVEHGIAGLNKYKYSDDPTVLGGDSRSGTGIQRRNVIHSSANYVAKKYLTELLKLLDKTL